MLQELNSSIKEAENYYHLNNDIENAKELQKEWFQKAEATERLEELIRKVKAPVAKDKHQSQSNIEIDILDLKDLQSRIQILKVIH